MRNKFGHHIIVQRAKKGLLGGITLDGVPLIAKEFELRGGANQLMELTVTVYVKSLDYDDGTEDADG